jgi:hypothetical protein
MCLTEDENDGRITLLQDEKNGKLRCACPRTSSRLKHLFVLGHVMSYDSSPFVFSPAYPFMAVICMWYVFL